MMTDSPWKVIMMGTLFTMNTTFYALNQAIGKARADIWLSLLLAAVPVTLGIWLLCRTARRFPEHTLLEATILRHPIVGRCLATVYLLFFFVILIRDLRLTVDFINMVLIPYTPIPVVMMLIVLTVVLIARNAGNTVIRMTEFWQPLMLFTGLITFFLLFNLFRIDYFLPMFDHGIVPSLEGAWFFFGYLGELVVLPFVFAGREISFLRSWGSLLISLVLLELIMFAMIAVLGVHIPSMLLYPIFNLIGFIKITDFLDRFELFLTSLYIPCQIVKSGVLLYILSRGTGLFLLARRQNAGSKAGANTNASADGLPAEAESFPLTVPLGAVCFAGAYLFMHDAIELFPLNRVWPVAAAAPVLLLPLLMFFFLRPRRAN